MGYLSVLLSGLGLSADAFGVSVCEGLRARGALFRRALTVAGLFGLFQMLMPVLGFYLGDLLNYVPALTGAVGWIAFLLLLFVAVKMLLDATESGQGACCETCTPSAGGRELLLLAVATSLDAMTVGVGFAAQSPTLLAASRDANVLFGAALIGATTFVLCTLGVLAGRGVGRVLGRFAPYLGGAVLLLLAVKMLLSNLGIELGF